MSARREVPEADALRLLYAQKAAECLRLRMELLDRDRQAAARALREAADRLGMAVGEALEADGGRFFLANAALRGNMDSGGAQATADGGGARGE